MYGRQGKCETSAPKLEKALTLGESTDSTLRQGLTLHCYAKGTCQMKMYMMIWLRIRDICGQSIGRLQKPHESHFVSNAFHLKI